MNEQTTQASGFGKKPYATPQVKAYQVKMANVICTSPNQAQQNEEYETVPTTTTSTWFNP